MVRSALEALLPRLGQRLAAQMGLYFPAARWPELERALEAAAPEMGFPNAAACVKALIDAPASKLQLDVLAGYLTIGETYFFRDKSCFRHLRDQVLPKLIAERRGTTRRLRIWSAGCCTGEEPYSLAIVLRQLLGDLGDWQIMILATDINPRFLQKAATGVYGAWSFRQTPESIKQAYFTRTRDGKLAVLPEIRRMVQFSYLNLAQDIFPSLLNNTSALDLIVCRNVLMYFSPEQVGKTIARFHRALVEGGWLVIGAAEAAPADVAEFSRGAPAVAGFYQKKLPAAERPVRPAGQTGGAVLRPIQKRSRRTGSAAPLRELATTAPRPTAPDQAPLPAPRLYEEALALYEQGRYPEVTGKLVTLLTDGGATLGPARVGTLALLARAYANQGKLSEALAHCERAILMDKLNARWHYLHATVLQEQGFVAQAMVSLRRALFLDPHFVLAHFAIGNLSRQQGDENAARKHFKNCRQLLERYRQEELLPESEGITAGRLTEIITSMTQG